jgi:serine phosphatase RsbU (regulator of sigma subunit)
LIYGPIGIAGMATGEFLINIIFFQLNLIDIVKNIGASLLYFLFVYFSGYFIYKVYYAFNFKNKEVSLRLNNVKNLIKFIVVSIIIFAFSSYLMTLTDYYLFNFRINEVTILKDVYFDFFFLMGSNLIISLLIMSTFSLFNLKVYKPKKSKHFINHSKTFNILIFISSIALVIQIIYIILFNALSSNVNITIFFNVVLIMLFVVFKPITKDVNVKKVDNSFNEFIVFIFMLIYTIFWMSDILLDFIEDKYNGSFVNMDKFILQNLGFESVMNIIIVLILFIVALYYIQNNFSDSLHSLYKITKDYATIKFSNISNENNDSKDIEDILYDLKSLSNGKFEIGQLADSLKMMIEDNELYITNLKKTTIEKEKMVADLDLGFKIQSSVIPNIFPPFPDRLNDFDIYASFNPARNVGGDFYDYFLIDDDHLALVMGDVSCKGVPAALFMMIVKSLIHYLIHSGLSPSEAFYQLNNRLLEDNDKEMFVTVWLGILEISSGKLTYVNSGHNLPYLFSKSNNEYHVLKAKPNFVLGGMDNIKYIQHEIKIMEGDRLYLYTDGITESINQNMEEFSNERLLNVLNNKNHYSIKDLILEISNEVHSFSKNMEQFDDETMLLLEYMKKNI